MRKYEYRIWPTAMVTGVLAAIQKVECSGEGYVSTDAELLDINTALDLGFRWVHTVDDMAVFEREVKISIGGSTRVER